MSIDRPWTWQTPGGVERFHTPAIAHHVVEEDSLNTNILSVTLPFFSDVLAPFRRPEDFRAEAQSFSCESVDLRKVVGIEREGFAGLTWGVLLRGNGAEETPMKRLKACLSDLKGNPGYYLDDRDKVDWAFYLVDGNYYIMSGHSRTVVGRVFLEANGMEPVVHGVHVARYDTAVWNAGQAEPEPEPESELVLGADGHRSGASQ